MASKSPWRRIVVDDRELSWNLGRHEQSVEGAMAVRLTLSLCIRAADDRHPRIEALFHGTLVPFLFSGHEQDLLITPRIVRRVIEVAVERGWPKTTGQVFCIDPAEVVVPEASVRLDVADAELRAAAAEWFVAYPGRAALQAAWTECEGDVRAISERLEIEPKRLVNWLERLGIRGTNE